MEMVMEREGERKREAEKEERDQERELLGKSEADWFEWLNWAGDCSDVGQPTCPTIAREPLG